MTTGPRLVVFIQARMSSRRFPGKVLAPFRGRPLVAWVVEAARQALGEATVVVVTSHHPSDDPLAAYLTTVDVPCVRGPLDDVLDRFVGALDRYPAERVVRLSADSPLLDPRVIRAVACAEAPDADLVTTIFPRTLPRGQNAECVRGPSLRALNREPLSPEQREHVTRGFYDEPSRYRILQVPPPVPDLVGRPDMAVDTTEDLSRLEHQTVEAGPSPSWKARLATG